MIAAEPDLLARIDAGAIRPRYWIVFTLIVLQLLCEIFDFFVVGFLVSAVAPLWKLNFGQTTIILLSAGVGSMVGAVGFGWAADRFGRKLVVVGTGVMCSLCAGAIAFVPDGGWIVFALLRFLVGVGYGGAGASQFALITEYTPTARRTLLTSLVGVPAGLGLLIASLVVSHLFPVLGWRGVAALGFIPLVFAAALAVVAPESARWLIARGRMDKAQRAAASMFDLDRAPPAAPDSAASAPTAVASVVVFSRARRIWLVCLVQLGLGTTLTGVLLWGPTIVAQLFRITPQQAATYFVGVSLSGLAGRILFAILPQRIGRVPCGRITGFAGAAALACAALFYDRSLAGLPLFFLFLLIGQFFYDGAFSNVITYGAELFPVRQGGRVMGLSSAAGGAGKIVGPLVMGLMAGAHNLVTPHATDRATTPAFLFLAAACLMVGLSYTFLGIETHRRPLAVD